MTLPVDILSQTHPDYNAERIQELEDLYVGGYQAIERASTYLPKLVGEGSARWDERTKAAAYIPYLGEICDFFASNLFAQPLSVEPVDGQPAVSKDFYEAFAEDADLASSSVVELLRRVFTTSLYQGRAYLGVDLPAAEPGFDPVTMSRLEEERSGADRAYAYELPVSQVIDWEIDTVVRRRVKLSSTSEVVFDVGAFKWVTIYRYRYDRSDPSLKREKRIDEWKIWRKLDDGAIAWELYRLESAGTPSASASAPGASVPLVASGVTSFQRIPVLELRLPKGLWIGNKVGPINKEHWQRRSILNSSENRSLVAIPYVKLGSEAGSPIAPALVQRDHARGETLNDQFEAKGYVVLGADDEIGYAEPNGGANEIGEARLSKLVDEMHRVSHQMAASVSNTANAVGRSGASKKEDRSSTVTVLYAFGAIVREFARVLYETVSEARGESVSWEARGLDRYELADREQLIDEGTKIDSMQIPSKTFAIAHKKFLASRLIPTLAPQQLAIINDEIEKSIDEKEKEDAERKKALLLAPPPVTGAPVPPQQPPPQPPAPRAPLQ
jgi:hypothetical protein